MSDEEAAMGNESPIVEGLENFPEPPKQKGKGGKSKEVNNARGIPEAIRKKMGYDTPPNETDGQRKIRLQKIRRYWAIRWYKYKSNPDWKWAMQFAFNPPYLYTHLLCVASTLLRIEEITSPFPRRSLTPILSRLQMTTLKRRKDS